MSSMGLPTILVSLRSKARMFKRLNGPLQRRKVLLCHTCQVQSPNDIDSTLLCGNVFIDWETSKAHSWAMPSAAKTKAPLLKRASSTDLYGATLAAVASRWCAWATPRQLNYTNNRSGLTFTGTLQDITFGFDYRVLPNLVVGLAFTPENTRVDIQGVDASFRQTGFGEGPIWDGKSARQRFLIFGPAILASIAPSTFWD